MRRPRLSASVLLCLVGCLVGLVLPITPSPAAVADGAIVAKIVHSDRTITFVVDGDAYEWTSAEPVVAITPVPERLWVWHDAAFEFNHPFGVGAFDALPHR